MRKNNKNNLKSKSVTDFELLFKTIFYLQSLRDDLPFARLVDHCSGAIGSLYELYFYLNDNNLKDYGNN